MGWTPLMYASESGFDGMVLQLLEAGAIVNAQNESLGTACMKASMKEYDTVVKRLVDANADVHVKDNVGCTALMYATDAGIVDLLLKTGASNESKDVEGRTAMTWAVQEKRHWLFKSLLQRDADVNASTEEKIDALMIASEAGDLDTLAHLIKHCGVSVNETRDKGV